MQTLFPRSISSTASPSICSTSVAASVVPFLEGFRFLTYVNLLRTFFSHILQHNSSRTSPSTFLFLLPLATSVRPFRNSKYFQLFNRSLLLPPSRLLPLFLATSLEFFQYFNLLQSSPYFLQFFPSCIFNLPSIRYPFHFFPCPFILISVFGTSPLFRFPFFPTRVFVPSILFLYSPLPLPLFLIIAFREKGGMAQLHRAQFIAIDARNGQISRVSFLFNPRLRS